VIMLKKWPEIVVIILTLLLIAAVILVFDRKTRNLQNKITQQISVINH
jgi:hypothetical protein